MYKLPSRQTSLSAKAKITQTLNAFFSIIYVRNNGRFLHGTATYISSEDHDEPVTPSHLIVGRRLLSLPDNLNYLCDPDDEKVTLDKNQVTSRVRHLNNHFWKRWGTEYLSCLREVHSQLSQGGISVIAIALSRMSTFRVVTGSLESCKRFWLDVMGLPELQ